MKIYYIYDRITPSSSYNEKKMFQIKVVEKIKTHSLCSVTPPPAPENRAVYEMTWEKYGRARQVTDNNIIRRMRFACWINPTRNF
jgi:hypothetical protein